MTKREKKQLDEVLDLLRWAWKRNPSGRTFYEGVAKRLKKMAADKEMAK